MEKTFRSEKKPEITGRYSTVAEWKEVLDKWSKGDPTVKGYDRYGYPALEKREKEVSELVGTDVLLYNCGMAAIVEALESHHLTKGDVLLYSPDVYEQSKKFIEDELVKRGVKCISMESGKPDKVNALIKKWNPKVIFAETVGNTPEMPVVDIDTLFSTVEKFNEKYQQETTLSKVLEKKLRTKPWIREWLDVKPGEKWSKEQEQKLRDLIPEFEKTARKVNQDRSFMPIRDLVKLLRDGEIELGDDRSVLLEIASVLDYAWLAKRETPMALILDNTLATPTGLDLAEKIKKTEAPVIGVESGTKFYALDLTTAGLVYSNSPDKMAELKVRRAVTGSYLPPEAEALLPERTKQEFDIRNTRTLANTMSLAQSFSKIIGKMGIRAVSHPNLPSHPNYERASQTMPDGATAIFYLECENAWETATELEKKLGDRIEYGGSFGHAKTRFLPLDDHVFRIAGGAESAEEIEEIKKIIES